MFKIDFIGIGETKSATSWIFDCLIEHPQVCKISPKEIHFFDRNYQYGMDWYKNFFQHCSKDKLKGEFTPSYLSHKKALIRIKKNFPKAKLIICLRNQLDRMISRYYYNQSRGKMRRSVSIEDFVKKSDLRNYLYYQNIKELFDLFPKEQILILIYDDIKKDKKAFVKKIYHFLNIDTKFVPKGLYLKKNETVSKKIKIIRLNNYLWRMRSLVRSLKYRDSIIRILKAIGINYLAKIIFRWNRKKKFSIVEKKYPPEEEIKRIKNFYKKDIEKLERIINRDLSEWLN